METFSWPFISSTQGRFKFLQARVSEDILLKHSRALIEDIQKTDLNFTGRSNIVHGKRINAHHTT